MREIMVMICQFFASKSFHNILWIPLPFILVLAFPFDALSEHSFNNMSFIKWDYKAVLKASSKCSFQSLYYQNLPVALWISDINNNILLDTAHILIPKHLLFLLPWVVLALKEKKICTWNTNHKLMGLIL